LKEFLSIVSKPAMYLGADAIRALRELVPVISEATAQDILKICPTLPPHLAEQLVVTFQSWDGKILGSSAI
jgi:hypothetical protein